MQRLGSLLFVRMLHTGSSTRLYFSDDNYMLIKSAPLPVFDAPPVIEVALGVQFNQLALEVSHLAEYWTGTLRQRGFSKWREAQQVPGTVEWFGVPQPNVFAFQAFLGAPPRSRAMFFDDTETSLLQLQPDRLVGNWIRGTQPPSAYPRYSVLRPKFVTEVRALSDFAQRSNLGMLVPNQVEVTYVNQFSGSSSLAEVFRPWSGATSDDWLPPAEASECTSRFVIQGDDGKPIGRLHATVAPRVHTGETEPSLNLTITARGRLAGDSIDDALKFLDIGHEWVVRSFASLTTPEMHKQWRRRT
jgi:uncharacterized protein (TIGR04255 family)